MLHAVESTKPVTQVMVDLETAVARHKFGILGVHNSRETMQKKGVAFARDCMIVGYPTKR